MIIRFLFNLTPNRNYHSPDVGTIREIERIQERNRFDGVVLVEGNVPQSSVLDSSGDEEDIREWIIPGKYFCFLLCLSKTVSFWRARIMFFFITHWASIVLNSLNKNKVPIKCWLDEQK